MTVQELIDALNKVTDKSKLVIQHDYRDVHKIEELEYFMVILY